jgi:hypothetical protein
MASEITGNTLTLGTAGDSEQSRWFAIFKSYREKLISVRPYLSPYQWTSQRFEDEMLRHVHAKANRGEHGGSLTIEDIRAIRQ